MLMTTDGGYVCPSSFPGEAAIHRVSATPPIRPKSKPHWGNTLLRVALGYGAGRVTGNVLFGGAPKQTAYLPPVPNPVNGGEQVQNASAYFKSRLGG